MSWLGDRTTLSALHPAIASPRTVFVDRDGVINANRPDHVKTWEQFQFLPGALAGLVELTGQGFRIVVVTNQAIVGRGQIQVSELDLIHDRLRAEVAARGGRLDAILYCPHRPEDACNCRKPAPGLLLRAAEELGIQLDQAVLIGDHSTDLEAAQRAGCHSMLVLSGRSAKPAIETLPAGCLGVWPDLLAAARFLTKTVPAQETPSADLHPKSAPGLLRSRTGA